jgi:hypothetical protein
MDLGGFNWGVMTIVGPLLLAAVLLWALLRNRKTRRGDIGRSERGARDVYDESERVRQERDGDQR